MSAEEVLAVFRTEYRYSEQFDPEEMVGCEISFETTVEEWRDACDLVSWWGLGRALNADWEIDVSDPDWKGTLEPARRRTLRDVCELIASWARLPVVEPAGLLGGRCDTVGALRAMRVVAGLHEPGALRLRPSAPLGPESGSREWALVRAALKLAPGSVEPPRREDHPALGWFAWPFLSGLLALPAGGLLTGAAWLLERFAESPVSPGAVWGAAGAVAFALIGISIAGVLLTLRLHPTRYHWGEARTVGDLARRVAAQAAPTAG